MVLLVVENYSYFSNLSFNVKIKCISNIGGGASFSIKFLDASSKSWKKKKKKKKKKKWACRCIWSARQMSSETDN